MADGDGAMDGVVHTRRCGRWWWADEALESEGVPEGC